MACRPRAGFPMYKVRNAGAQGVCRYSRIPLKFAKTYLKFTEIYLIFTSPPPILPKTTNFVHWLKPFAWACGEGLRQCGPKSLQIRPEKYGNAARKECKCGPSGGARAAWGWPGAEIIHVLGLSAHGLPRFQPFFAPRQLIWGVGVLFLKNILRNSVLCGAIFVFLRHV